MDIRGWLEINLVTRVTPSVRKFGFKVIGHSNGIARRNRQFLGRLRRIEKFPAINCLIQVGRRLAKWNSLSREKSIPPCQGWTTRPATKLAVVCSCALTCALTRSGSGTISSSRKSTMSCLASISPRFKARGISGSDKCNQRIAAERFQPSRVLVTSAMCSSLWSRTITSAGGGTRARTWRMVSTRTWSRPYVGIATVTERDVVSIARASGTLGRGTLSPTNTRSSGAAPGPGAISDDDGDRHVG